MSGLTLPARVIRAAALMMPDVQRVALANQLVRGIASEDCILQLDCLANEADRIAAELKSQRAVRKAMPR